MTNEDPKRMSAAGQEQRFQFPRWANYLFPGILLVVIGLLTYIPLVGTLALSPATRAIGYQPLQPVAFSHAMHVGKLKMDCRYCHSTVEYSAFAAIPSTQTCLNCHASIKSDSPKLASVRKSFETGDAIAWIKVHDLPDFVYFNHAAHVNKGVACESCHGRIDQMEEVYQSQSLSMAWCLECHRSPAAHLRPRSDVTVMGWSSISTSTSPAPATSTPNNEAAVQGLPVDYRIASMDFMTSCSTCHR